LDEPVARSEAPWRGSFRASQGEAAGHRSQLSLVTFAMRFGIATAGKVCRFTSLQVE
jgi:hypothetical protein